MTEASAAPGGGMDGGRGRPFNSPPAVCNNKVRQLLDELIPKVLQLELITVVSVVPAIEAAAT
jgi:hypothetical protein